MAKNFGDISYGLSIAANESVRLNSGGTAFEAYTPSAGGGDVTKVGTPVDNQVGVWTGDGTIEGTTGLTYDGTNFNITGSLGATGTRVTKGWFTDAESTNMYTVGGVSLATTFSPIAGSASIVTTGTITTGVWNAGTVTTTQLAATSATGVIIGTDVGGGSPNISGLLKMYSAGDNAFYTTFTAGTQTANATYTLPTAMPAVSGYQLTCTNAGVMSWAAAGGLTWGDSITGTSGTGVTLTVGDSASASTVAQSIVVGNTQTNAITALSVNMGTSNVAHNCMDFKVLKGNGLLVDVYGVATQAVGSIAGIYTGTNFNTNSAFAFYAWYADNEQNAGAGRNVGLCINNKSTDFDVTSVASGSGTYVLQSGAGGTSMAVYGGANVNSATNGLVNYTISNTQSGATVMQKIDTGTSAQGHTGLFVQVYNASTSVRGIKIAGSTTCTGALLELNSGSTSASPNSLLFTGTANNNGTDYAGNFINTNGISLSRGNDRVLYQFDATQYDAAGANPVARTSDVFYVAHTMYMANGSGTAAPSYSMVHFQRKDQMANASGSYTASGSVVLIDHSIFNPAGTYTDTVKLLTVNLTSGNGDIKWNGTAISSITTTSGAVVAKTNNMFDFQYSRTNTATTGTIADNFQLGYFKRESVTTGAGGTLTAAGTVFKAENVATQTAGTLTDTVDVGNFTQSATATTGKLLTGVVGSTERFKVHPLVANSGTNNAYLFDTTTAISGTTTHSIFAVGGTAIVTINNAGNYLSTGSLQTAAPTTGTAAAWKLGSKISTGTSVFDATGYVELDIGGTLYKLGLVTNS